MGHESKTDALTDSDLGCEVQTGEGERLGSVKAVHGSFFEVDVPHEEDYWLAAHYIGSYEKGLIRLKLPRAEVDEHRLRAPGTETMTGQVHDAGILSRTKPSSSANAWNVNSSNSAARWTRTSAGTRTNPAARYGRRCTLIEPDVLSWAVANAAGAWSIAKRWVTIPCSRSRCFPTMSAAMAKSA